MEKRKHTLVENADEKRYEFDLGDDIAIIEYIKTQIGRASCRERV